MPQILIIQACAPNFRVPFFAKLHAALRNDGMDLTVAYSSPNRSHALRRDSAELSDEFGYKVKGYWLGERLLYQPLWRETMRADLTIVGAELKYLNNVWLLPLSALRLKTVAFWGLAPNTHPDPRSVAAEWIKERFVNTVSWWFAYTESVAVNLRQRGVLNERITVVQNSTDTVELRCLMNSISDDDIAEGKRALTGNIDSKIGFYCGRLESAKALPFLIESARTVRRRCPQFHLILAGTAGLAIVDCFAAGLPLVATKLPNHPPEISYVRDCENGLLTAHDPIEYAEGIIRVLEIPSLQASLRQGATIAGARYTIEAMVENFRMGIKRCLAHYSSSSQRNVSRQAVPKTQD